MQIDIDEDFMMRVSVCIGIMMVICTICFLYYLHDPLYYKKSCEDPLRYVYDGYYHKYVDGIGCLSDEEYKRYMDTIK